MEYGSKDLMRMDDIRIKSNGDWIVGMTLAKKMAELISLPGKAQARGYAAQKVFGPYSPLAYIFFERAFQLGGEDVRPEASVNPIDDIDKIYEGIPDDQIPASKRKNFKLLPKTKLTSIKHTCLDDLGKVNLIKGTGPQFNIHETPMGTIEVWKDENTVRPKLIWTVSNESNYSIEEKHIFQYNEKRVIWEMIDYIDTKDIGNLVPLYGKSLQIFSYN